MKMGYNKGMKVKACRMIGCLFMLALMMICTCSVYIVSVDLPYDHRHPCDMSTTDAVGDCNECLTLADKVLDVTIDIGGVVSMDVGFDVTIDALLVGFLDGSVHPPPPLYAIKMNC